MSILSGVRPITGDWSCQVKGKPYIDNIGAIGLTFDCFNEKTDDYIATDIETLVELNNVQEAEIKKYLTEQIEYYLGSK